MAIKAVALDAMGVLYPVGDDLRTFLYHFSAPRAVRSQMMPSLPSTAPVIGKGHHQLPFGRARLVVDQ